MSRITRDKIMEMRNYALDRGDFKELGRIKLIERFNKLKVGA